jgi:hypothetical protein
MSSSGPRFSLWVSTAAGELLAKLANAASNSGRPGDGIVQRSCSASDSAASSALPNPYRNCAAVRETARRRLAGLPRTGKAERSCTNGSGLTPLIGAGSLAVAADHAPRLT